MLDLCLAGKKISMVGFRVTPEIVSDKTRDIWLEVHLTEEEAAEFEGIEKRTRAVLNYMIMAFQRQAFDGAFYGEKHRKDIIANALNRKAMQENIKLIQTKERGGLPVPHTAPHTVPGVGRREVRKCENPDMVHKRGNCQPSPCGAGLVLPWWPASKTATGRPRQAAHVQALRASRTRRRQLAARQEKKRTRPTWPRRR